MRFKLNLLLTATLCLFAFTNCTIDKRELIIDKSVENESKIQNRPIGEGLVSKGAIKLNSKTICYLSEVTKNTAYFTEASDLEKMNMQNESLLLLQNSVGMKPLFDVEATIVFRYLDVEGNTLLEFSFTPNQYKLNRD